MEDVTPKAALMSSPVREQESYTSRPGCGDVDHHMGIEHGLVSIAPLGEDGRYLEGFGDFTGREAIAAETAQLVFEKLKDKGLLVATETYPHIYPHCWRTGGRTCVPTRRRVVHQYGLAE